MDEDTRAYYRETWGFDPVTEAIPLDRPGKASSRGEAAPDDARPRAGRARPHFRYEAAYPLAADPPLHAAGVTIKARVEVTGDVVQNQIVFARGKRETTVQCTHTIVFRGSMDDALTLAEDGILQGITRRPGAHGPWRRNLLTLPPEEHFVALRSFVQGVAEVGILALVRWSCVEYEDPPPVLPFGFNAAMQAQVWRALARVARKTMRLEALNLLHELADTAPREWFRSRLPLLDKQFGILGVVARDLSALEAVAGTPRAIDVKRAVAQCRKIAPDVLAALARDADQTTRELIALREKLPGDVANVLARDPAPIVRQHLVDRARPPVSLLETLARDADAAIAERARVRLELRPVEDWVGRVVPALPPKQKIKWGAEDPVPPVGHVARAGHVVGLRVTRQGFTTVPPALGTLVHLERLDLSNNKIARLPPEIGQLRALRVLNLKRNWLTGLPGEVANLTALEHLNLSRNKLVDLPAAVGQLEALTRLNLRGNRLRALCPAIGNLTRLEWLDASWNHLQALPGELGALEALTRLYVAHNQLDALPATVGGLHALETLGAAQNELRALPGTLGACSTLRRLELQENRLRACPAELGALARLEALQLDFNALETIPAELTRLGRLETLSLWGNQLRALPADLAGWHALRHLDLRGNALETLPPSIRHLHALQSLNLWGNHLRALPAEIGALPALEYLNAGENDLETLPATLGQIASLRQLDVRWNPLERLPDAITALAGIRVLKVDTGTLAGSFWGVQKWIERLEEAGTLVVRGGR